MRSEEKKLLSNIYRFGKNKLWYELLGKLSYLALIISALWLSAALADNLFYFSELTRWGLWFIGVSVLLYFLYLFFLIPLKNLTALKPNSNLTAVARLLGRFYPEIKDSLVNTYHLITREFDENISYELRKAGIKINIDKYGNRNFKTQLKLKQYLPGIKLALPVFISAIVLLSFKFDDMSHSTLRLVNPSNEYLRLPAYLFEVKPGNINIIKGESINFEVRYNGPPLHSCQLIIKDVNSAGSLRILPINRIKESYTINVKDIKKPVDYQINGLPLNNKQLRDHILSKKYHIDVRIPPMVKNLDVILIPPRYSGLQKQRLERNLGDITALAGTQAKVKLETNKMIESASLIFASGGKIDLDIRNKRISGNFTIRKNDSYKILLQDTSGLGNLNPIDYQIALLPDNPPFVEISEPGQDVVTQLDGSLQLKIEAGDDFGLSAVNLFYQYLYSSESAADTNWRQASLQLKNKTSKRQELYYLWNFDLLPLAFDDGIKYYAEAKDNNYISGPGVGKSKIFYIRFPSLDEIFDSFTENEERETEKLEDVHRETENLKKKLEEINREFKRANEVDWETKQQLEKTLEQQKELQDKVEEIQKNLEELIEKLDANNLISEEILEKYMQLQELFKEIATPELMRAMQNLQKALDKADPKQVRNALEQFKLNQEAFKKNIERTIELLKQVQLEQKLDQLAQKAKSLAEQQEKISNMLNNDKALGDKEYNQLKKQQAQQKEKLEQLQNDLKKFLQEPQLTKFPQANQMLDSTHSQMSDPSLSEQMQNMQQSLSSQQKKNAADCSQKLQKEFNTIKNSLMQAQQQLQGQHKSQVKKKMIAAAQKMLQLSHSQEKLQKQTQKASAFSDDFRDIANGQGQVKDNFQKLISELIQLAKETFFISPKINKSLGKAQSNMQQSLNNLSERNKGAAALSQERALAALNESVMQMRRSMSKMEQSQSGTGFEQFMEQLKQMAGSQGQINEETMSLLQGQGNQGKLSLMQQQAMRRLAAEQGALREALENMNKKMGDRRDMLGRLGELSGKMEEVVQDLLKQNIDRRTIERQRQILSRMLDAQKSIREREFSKKRKAEGSKKYRIKDPGKLGDMVDAEKKALQDALRRALNEGYNRDYQRLIEAYFKLLLLKQSE
jgi:hypothetical protein